MCVGGGGGVGTGTLLVNVYSLYILAIVFFIDFTCMHFCFFIFFVTLQQPITFERAKEAGVRECVF